ncbi:type I-B CRISPR-associated protein Cas7/Csh2 [Campylobacter hyointestinalis]|uniref:CRISPR-associated protein, Csh2 family n=1 Tax=Campylobacter hyointestinalis subsp. hyointestinalis TaxID=91352 RepID=A0A0S4SI29_CAMHY|nr:type I-B CRISPR-associated protein Cas7/Csh2 [Campylobacter hyointestinalis]PPB69072.1 type I-B CRISPR-associated protein Cas7/Csh2 [Campylobacter hyointestinalis subsp. hyointestinalis]PPB73387.1 type I-B CRISPR-associated protein Cas7/Csh2 [Campylobacter hyointestinalis subsp. hyointestinalis]PPB75599.1 type I-B CRISPR-associated protein Cas7/Csh2 [Campylobacter hyointestinalis subsp. hyointestinalis]PPB78260.1 type I-B CRISPR-associated protein Cas7/Csh2 [Campylobacter hyointestinalis sub
MQELAKQSEILFLWDGENWNPNGDMLNDNAPRFDELSQKAIVSDVRIKRTIRDYLQEKGEEIFVKETRNANGKLMDGKGRVSEIVGKESDKIKTIMQRCIDVRAFGGVFPVDKEINSLTGTMQFKMSKSLHKTEISFIKGTGAFASKEDRGNKTFREEYILPYALFGTYGIINEFNAKNTFLIKEDVDKICKALWFGTKNLISRSKFGQLPRFLLKITYNEAGCYIGELDNLVKINTQKLSEIEITSCCDYKVDLSEIISSTDKYSSKIKSIEYIHDKKLAIENIPSNWKKIDFGI